MTLEDIAESIKNSINTKIDNNVHHIRSVQQRWERIPLTRRDVILGIAFSGIVSPFFMPEQEEVKIEAPLPIIPVTLSGDLVKDVLQWKDRYEFVAANHSQLPTRFGLSTKETAALLAALTSVESSGNPNARSETDAVGLFQLTKGTANNLEIFGYERFQQDPREQVRKYNDKVYAYLARRGEVLLDNRTRPYVSAFSGNKVLEMKATYLDKKLRAVRSPQDLFRLTLTAYNTGEKCVEMAANETDVEPLTFEAIRSVLNPELIKKCLPYADVDPEKQSKSAQNFALKVLSRYETFKPHFL